MNAMHAGNAYNTRHANNAMQFKAMQIMQGNAIQFTAIIDTHQ